MYPVTTYAMVRIMQLKRIHVSILCHENIKLYCSVVMHIVLLIVLLDAIETHTSVNVFSYILCHENIRRYCSVVMHIVLLHAFKKFLSHICHFIYYGCACTFSLILGIANMRSSFEQWEDRVPRWSRCLPFTEERVSLHFKVKQ